MCVVQSARHAYKICKPLSSGEMTFKIFERFFYTVSFARDRNHFSCSHKPVGENHKKSRFLGSLLQHLTIDFQSEVLACLLVSRIFGYNDAALGVELFHFFRVATRLDASDIIQNISVKVFVPERDTSYLVHIHRGVNDRQLFTALGLSSLCLFLSCTFCHLIGRIEGNCTFMTVGENTVELFAKEFKKNLVPPP